MNKKITRFVSAFGKYILIYGLAFISFFPMLWMVLASLQQQKDILNASKGLFSFLPTLMNYSNVIYQYDFVKPMINSFIIALLSTIFALVLSLPAAYAIARYKLRKMSLIILVVRMIPGISFLVPWFTIFAKLQLTDSYTALILTHMLVALPLIVWIMTPFFESIPMELEMAAWVDGSSKFRTFFAIVLPLCRAGILTASLLAFIFSWNNFMFALVLSGRKTITLPVAIFSFVSYAAVDWGGLMAASVLITLPICIISIFLQKYIIGGLTAGAVKG